MIEFAATLYAIETMVSWVLFVAFLFVVGYMVYEASKP